MKYLCAGYNRLSDADNKNDESSSIQSQKMIIEAFAKFNNLKIVKHYIDDGYSGGNFDRPGFQEMINDIKQGKINCVITKDLSRLGRELYKTGKYIEEYFMEHNVRYIAINDSYDSNIGDSMLGIRLSVNDLYLRDVSKKVKSSLRAKQNRGDYIGSIPLYGYKKDPNNKHRLVIDDEVREIIVLIYNLALKGESPQKIAETLTYRKIPIPIVHKKDFRAKNIVENDGFGIWKRQTIVNILTNEMYIGNMVQNTHNKISYNSKKLRKTDKNEHIIVPNTHEALVSKETFSQVQLLLKNRMVERKTDAQLSYLLGGLLYCKECGRSLRISRDILKSGIRHYTQCNLYTRKGKYGICSSHRVNYDWLESDIIEYLQQLCKNFCEKYDFDQLDHTSETILTKNILEINYKIENRTNILNKYKNTIDNIYMDKVHGVISEDMFKRLYDKTEIEMTKLKTELNLLNEQKKINKIHQEQTSQFLHCRKSVIEYMTLQNPTKEQITKLVDKIEIDKDKTIYVYLKFPDFFKTK